MADCTARRQTRLEDIGRAVKTITHILTQYGYWLLVGTVLSEQLGLPLPAIPVLLAMGALAGLGYFSFAGALVVTVLACLVADFVWYELGKQKGISVLRTLCRISLEPDSCVTNAQGTFEAQGARALLVAKFVPGLSTMAPPMAGLSGMSASTFLFLDAVGSFAWALAYLYIGWAFREQLEIVADWAARFGSGVGFFLAVVVGSWIAWKYYQRRKFIRTLRVARITPEEVMQKIGAGDKLAIVDLRNAVEQRGAKLPGALLFRFSELDERHTEIPRDRDIILYCT